MQSVEEEAPRAQAGMVLGIKKGKKGTATTETPPPAKKKGADGSRRIKKEKKKVEEADPTNKTNMTPAPPQAHPIVQEWVLRALDFGVEKLREEFRGLAKYVRSDMTQNVFNSNHSTDINITKNRYQDVPCQDQCIVKLEPPSPSTYIHANYVGSPMYPEKRFICCQGPLDHTCEDFWWMVIQNKVEQIVMLCKTVETGKLKCAQYWPGAQGEKKEFKSGVVVENMSGTKTGTIVAIEYILEKIAEDKQCPPMPDLVKQLRDQRAYSIQNDLQYLYIHRVMLNYFLDKYKEKYASLLTRTLQSTRSLSRTTTQQLDSDLFFSFTS